MTTVRFIRAPSAAYGRARQAEDWTGDGRQSYMPAESRYGSRSSVNRASTNEAAENATNAAASVATTPPLPRPIEA
jgi:hypothetical protein